MNLPMGLSALFEIGVKKREDTTAAARQDTEDYQNTLDEAIRLLKEFSEKLDSYEGQAKNNQLSAVQTAMDLTYIKELGDKLQETLAQMKEGPMNQTLCEIEGINASIAEAGIKLDGLDTIVANRLKELFEENQKQLLVQCNQHQTELSSAVEGLAKYEKRGRKWIGLLFFFHLISLSGIIFIILYIFDIISF